MICSSLAHQRFKNLWHTRPITRAYFFRAEKWKIIRDLRQRHNFHDRFWEVEAVILV